MDEYSNEDYKQRSSMAFPFWSWKDNLKLSSKLSGKGRQNFQAKEDRDFWRGHRQAKPMEPCRLNMDRSPLGKLRPPEIGTVIKNDRGICTKVSQDPLEQEIQFLFYFIFFEYP